MIWMHETEEKLIQLKRAGVTYSAIAQELGCSLNAATTKGYELIQAGRLERHVRQPRVPREDLIKIIRHFQSRDACPNKYRHSINKEFGSWSAGLKAAGLTSKIGGIFDSTKPATLYLLKFDEFYKVGITQRKIEQRFHGAPDYVVLDTYCSDLDEVLSLEREILSKVERFEPKDRWFERNGKTECFLFPFDPTFEDLI